MKEPVDHIIRPPLPWRADVGMTECGYDASKVKSITREQFIARRKELGQQRCALLTCMTCSDVVTHWRTWEDDPRSTLGREIEWERGGTYWHTRTDRGERLKDELYVIADLIAAHRDEFEAMLQFREHRREWLGKKAALEKGKPKPPSKPKL